MRSTRQAPREISGIHRSATRAALALTAILAVVVVFATQLARAEKFNTPLQHIIVVIQENRTPDNLFGADTALIQAGAHIAASGSCYGANIPLVAYPLNACFDPSHSHDAWTRSYDDGNMDGACDANGGTELCSPAPPNCSNGSGIPCVQYSYVDNSTGLLNPYFQLAAQYGFANYMFQTNQGPSFPAHQFLFSGTSAPVAYPTTYYDWFAAENPGGITGCVAKANTVVLEIDPATGTESAGYTPPGNTAGFPCYEHNTLADVLDQAGISWKYYSIGASTIWTAPNAINHICQPNQLTGGKCVGPDWPPNSGNKVKNQDFSILTDLGVNGTSTKDCKLPQVSWVIPEGQWSDHSGKSDSDGGPSWVAAIVNAVGGYDNSGNLLPVQCNYWANTAILIVWDDWGGFYDDVNPIQTIGGGNQGYPGSGGIGQQYVYGFRVPLLVVSPYAKQGYISGAGINTPTCPNFYCHDFGSILNFIEYAFGQNGVSLGPIGPSEWPFADSFVQDTGASPNNYSLYDFFNFSGSPSSFTPITGAKYQNTCFFTPSASGCFGADFTPEPPDSDGDDLE